MPVAVQWRRMERRVTVPCCSRRQRNAVALALAWRRERVFLLSKCVCEQYVTRDRMRGARWMPPYWGPVKRREKKLNHLLQGEELL